MENSLTGTWSLLSWYNETEDGLRKFPFGEDVKGLISYTTDGFVFVQISMSDRKNYASDDPFGGTAEEDSSAMKSQITYAGKFELCGDTVIHHVTQASFPNWVGTAQLRHVRFDNGSLMLSAKNTMFNGQRVNATLCWERAR